MTSRVFDGFVLSIGVRNEGTCKSSCKDAKYDEAVCGFVFIFVKINLLFKLTSHKLFGVLL